jgi:integrase
MVLALMILTGQRVTEVINLDKAEIDGVWWTIPAERIGKSDSAQKVYLSPQARAILKFWQPCSFDHRTIARAVKRMNMNFTPHDLRRTMATRLSDLGVMPHVIEKMLNHQMEGVMAVYNRAEYLNERKEAWRVWGLKISTLRRASESHT